MGGIGRLLIIFGVILVGLGFLLIFLDKPLSFLGRLPGDIYIQKKNFLFYFPLTTCLLISLFLSLFLWLLFKR